MKVIRLAGVALVVVCGLVAACSGPVPERPRSRSTEPPGGTRTAASPLPRTPTPSTAKRAPRTRQWVVGQASLKGRRLYVFVGPADGVSGTLRLRVSALPVGRFATIGPRIPRAFHPDTLFVLDRRHLWFTTFWDGGGRERLYRTSDAGASWKWTSVPSHSMAAGSTDALWFSDADHGWLTDIQPTAPYATLYATVDGGRHWHLVADTQRRAARVLPTLGPVEFQPDNTTAWDAVPAYFPATGLYVTRNAGASWQIALSARHRAFAAPGVFGSTVVEPVSWCARRTTDARLLVSHDGGVRWARRPTVVMGAVPASDYGGSDCRPVAATEPTVDSAWLSAAALGNRLVVKNTCDQGRHWHTARPPRLGIEDVRGISATGCRQALLDVYDLNDIERLYLTNDGGNSWQSIDGRATS